MPTYSDIWEAATSSTDHQTVDGRLESSTRTALHAALRNLPRTRRNRRDAALIIANLERDKSPLLGDAREARRVFDQTDGRTGLLRRLRAPTSLSTRPSLAWDIPPARTSAEFTDITRRISALQERLTHHHAGLAGRVFHRGMLFGTSWATLRIHERVPAVLQHGILASPGRTFRAIVRLSNGSAVTIASNGQPPSDLAPDLRGMAVKVFTQDGRPVDWITISPPRNFTDDIRTFIDVGGVIAENAARGGVGLVTQLVKALIGRPSLLPDLPRSLILIAREILAKPVVSYARQTFFGSVFRFSGGYAFRYRFRPSDENLRGPAQLGTHPSALADDLKQRLATNDLRYVLEIELYAADEVAASKVFRASEVHVVATLTIPRASQRPSDDLDIDRISFNPANCMGIRFLEDVESDRALDPEVGGMQGRWLAYAESARRREALSDHDVWDILRAGRP